MDGIKDLEKHDKAELHTPVFAHSLEAELSLEDRYGKRSFDKEISSHQPLLHHSYRQHPGTLVEGVDDSCARPNHVRAMRH